MKKIIYGLAGVLVGTGVYFLLPAQLLSSEARIALAMLCCAVLWWIAKLTEDYVTALLMAVFLILFSHLSPGTVFKAFSGSSWWLLLTAFALSSGVKKCGLLRRISIKILRLFPSGYRWQLLGMYFVSGLTAPFIPSLSAKSAILAPLSMGLSRSMGYKEGSPEDQGLFLAMLTGIRNAAPLFISASVLGYAIMGFLPQEQHRQFTMINWFVGVLPWFLLMSLFNYLFILKRYSPKENPKPCKVTQQQREVPDAMSKEEKQMLWILLITMALWISESIHNIPAYIIAILALVAMHVLGIMDRASFRTDISWDYLVFIGLVLGLSGCFSELGINDFVVNICRPAAEFLSFSPFIFLLGIGIITVLMRFLIVSELTFINIFLVFLIPIALELGINPWAAAITVYFFISPWFFLYQNPVYMAAYYAVDGKMIKEGEAAGYCLYYLIFAALALSICLPYWKLLGFLYI